MRKFGIISVIFLWPVIGMAEGGKTVGDCEQVMKKVPEVCKGLSPEQIENKKGLSAALGILQVSHDKDSIVEGAGVAETAYEVGKYDTLSDIEKCESVTKDCITSCGEANHTHSENAKRDEKSRKLEQDYARASNEFGKQCYEVGSAINKKNVAQYGKHVQDKNDAGGTRKEAEGGFLKKNGKNLAIGAGLAALGYLGGKKKGESDAEDDAKEKIDKIKLDLAVSECLRKGEANCAETLKIDCEGNDYKDHEVCTSTATADTGGGEDTACVDPSSVSNDKCRSHYISACASSMTLKGCSEFNAAYCKGSGDGNPAGSGSAYCTLSGAYDYCSGGKNSLAPACVWIGGRGVSCRSNPASYDCLPQYTKGQYASACASNAGDPLCSSDLGKMIADGKDVTPTPPPAAFAKLGRGYSTQSIERRPADVGGAFGQSLWAKSAGAFTRACNKGSLSDCGQ